jgi:plasmid stabilization system protein ParE
MSLPLVVRAAAQVEMLDARDWYEQQRAGLGDEFVTAVEQLFERISSMPEMYGVVTGDVRRAKLRRFPYVVYYRVLTDQVVVIAVLHGRRDSQAWQSRV